MHGGWCGAFVRATLHVRENTNTKTTHAFAETQGCFVTILIGNQLYNGCVVHSSYYGNVARYPNLLKCVQHCEAYSHEPTPTSRTSYKGM